MATSQDEMKLTFRKFKDGENKWSSMHDKIFVADTSHKCPVYVHRTPPCQGSCPSGEDIRGWLQIVRGIEKPPKGVDWHEYAFRRSTDANPFPAMSIYDNVVAGLKLTGRRASHQEKDHLVESCLTAAGLWSEVKDRLREPGGGLSGGQQQRLCIARSLAVRPKVLLMDEPCSALDPTSTRVIEETMGELQKEVTIVIVTHNMQQAQRVSQQCAFFLASQGTPGVIVEYGETDAIFNDPQDERTSDYVSGRFG